jgi:hypothetical protein
MIHNEPEAKERWVTDRDSFPKEFSYWLFHYDRADRGVGGLTVEPGDGKAGTMNLSERLDIKSGLPDQRGIELL